MMYICCNKQQLIPAWAIIGPFRFQAAYCTNCEEVKLNGGWFSQWIFETLAGTFWDGKVITENQNNLEKRE